MQAAGAPVRRGRLRQRTDWRVRATSRLCSIASVLPASRAARFDPAHERARLQAELAECLPATPDPADPTGSRR